MNVQGLDILNAIRKNPKLNQREIANQSGYSLGFVNRVVKELQEEKWLSPSGELSEKAKTFITANQPKKAVILAAGFGMRMVPINTEIPKGLLEVRGEVLIERMIRHLHEVGITDIQVVVGFMKERYEYLIDEFNVQLVVNSEYQIKNNLHSLSKVKSSLDKTYIVPCDIWAEENPFSDFEPYSWYMVSDETSVESTVRVNRKRELVMVDEDEEGNQMIGLCYVMGQEAKAVQEKLQEFSKKPSYDHEFWECTLQDKNKWMIPSKVVDSKQYIEINTYEQLREIDGNSANLQTDAISIIQECFNVEVDEIKNITVLKKGMTNRSFLFECQNKKYIMRIPGEGTDHLINRKEEADVYQALENRQICDDVLYMNPENGYKITAYLEDATNCDAENWAEVEACMTKLREFHELNLTVDHRFDIFGQIDFYESLWNGEKSYFKDYEKTKAAIFELKKWIDTLDKTETLVHIDAVPDNFLFTNNGIRIIDWEYAGMQDPHVDIAMFCIYSLYSKEKVDHLIDLYFKGEVSPMIRTKIYAYIASAGLLWSNWCEYKRSLGIDFGEYSLCQYRYAKEYSKLVLSTLEEV
ncbi:phosphotransferase [uncultured Granulicatella sp.]|uniref:phosphotransferase n=1 Tax=uncultured Granulicatella sp. TaxID=316089 RepID=UPI0028DCD836|nr:phosphotransferase [uncultured Granulicatella sp.]